MFKKIFFLLVIIFCGVTFLLYGKNTDSKNLIKNEEKKYIPPVATEWKTSQGIKVIYYEDDEIPVVRGAFYIRGNIDETKNPIALKAMGTLLKSGGTKKYPSSKLDKELEKLSASVSSSWGSEYGKISFSALSQDVDKLFDIIGDMILNPVFEQKEIDLWKLREKDSILRQKDYPDSIGYEKYKNILYKSSNYGYISNEKDVDKITREILLKEKEDFVVPNDSYLTIVGPISKEEINNLINKNLGLWKKVERKVVEKNNDKYLYTPKGKEIYFMKKDDLNQASVYIISKGPTINEEDILKYDVFSEYFGAGGFSSALFNKLRNDKGLVYTTYGGVFPKFPYGSSIIYFATSDKNLMSALKLVENITNDIKKKENVDKEMLSRTKNTKLIKRIFDTDSFDNLVSKKFIHDFLSFSNSYDALYPKRVKDVTSEDISRISEKYFNLEDAFIVIIASESSLNNLKILLKDNESIFSKFNLNLCDVKKDSCKLISNF